jgi:hypothetical protein
MERAITVNINLDGAVNALTIAVQRINDLVAYGLQSTRSTVDVDFEITGFDDGGTSKPKLKMPETSFQFYPTPAAANIDQIRKTFPSWLLGCGLRECVESLHIALEEIRKAVCVIELHGKPNTTYGELEQALRTGQKRFGKAGLPEKMGILGNRLPLKPDAELLEAILSVNSLRNCLVHRFGWVAQEDCNAANVLAVRWRYCEIFIMGTDGERIAELPAFVDKGETVAMRWKWRENVFALGQQIQLGSQDFSDIGFTLFQFIQDYAKKVEEYGKAQGIAFGQPKAA